MSNQKKPRTPPSTASDERGETTSIELISTQVLKTLLAEETDALNILQVTAGADADEDGILARDDNGNFELLEKSSLDSLMNTPVHRSVTQPNPRGRQSTPKPAQELREKDVPVPKIDLKVPESLDDLELVDTTMLRIILDDKLKEEGKAPKFAFEAEDAERAAKGRADKHGGFNPYDSSKKLRR